MMESGIQVNQNSSSSSKIALFRSLFRGREDLYPLRFENKKSGKSGYAPACANEWVRGICEKPRIKCSECAHRRLLPVTDEVVHWHLSGSDSSGKNFVMGVYPMLLDETCFFLAADFDNLSWKEDASAFLKTCHSMNLPAVLERSRSGKGAHVWLFFSKAIPAIVARKLGSHLITETMESRPDIGLASYDRLFPNQDTLPKGGFGNLIALPLQKRARIFGNSVFVDENFVPYKDQWAFLSALEKIDPTIVEDIVQRADAKGRVIGVRLDVTDEDNPTPWKTKASFAKPCISRDELPKSLKIVRSNEIYIPKEELPPSLKNRFLRLAAFQNPEFYKAQAMRLSTYGIPRIISCAQDYTKHIALPRGCLDEMLELMKSLNIQTHIEDERISGSPLQVNFTGELRIEQKAAAQEMLNHDIGILSATTAFGKTVVASWLISKRQVNTLVLVHRKQLMEQWILRLSQFLDISPKAIGRVGGGRKKPTGLLDVALIQSLCSKGVVHDCVGQYGHVIVDECHHLSAFSFEQVIRHAKAQFITGLSATVTRKDGHHPIVQMQCGPVRYRVSAKEQAKARPFDHNVFVRPTAFQPKNAPNSDLRIQFNDLYEELSQDIDRNQLICDDIIKAVRNGRSPVVLSERNKHLDLLFELLKPQVKNIFMLRGGMSSKEIAKKANELGSIPQSQERLLLATGKFIGEGFDDARLDTLFLTLPISWRGTIAQYAGRLHRLYDHKREVQIYDYADLNIPMLERMFNRRCKGYEAIGYTILLPASACPGWPAEVLLPVDPLWKADYAASVRRLIRDGVDVPLASLFMRATSTFSPDAEGADRARSATEAFLFRRLETLRQTSGKFLLNQKIDIPFDNFGTMEVDLLCDSARLAIELDGNQHLGDAKAYRRDRKKDLLLQENGYLVLRFLTEDVGKYLDEILDSILHALQRRQNLNTILGASPLNIL